MSLNRSHQVLLIETLNRIGFYTHFSQEELINILKRTRNVMNFKKGDYIIKEGVCGGMFYLLAKGRVSVMKKNQDGKKIAFAEIEDADFFGEISLLDGCNRITSIMAEDDVFVFMIGNDDFQDLFIKNPKIKSMIEIKSIIRKAAVEKMKN